MLWVFIRRALPLSTHKVFMEKEENVMWIPPPVWSYAKFTVCCHTGIKRIIQIKIIFIENICCGYSLEVPC